MRITIISKKVVKFVKTKDLKFKQQVTKSFKIIAQTPFGNNLDIKRLKGLSNAYRLRIGKYRFLYEIKVDKVIIYFYDADSRGDVYKK